MSERRRNSSSNIVKLKWINNEANVTLIPDQDKVVEKPNATIIFTYSKKLYYGVCYCDENDNQLPPPLGSKISIEIVSVCSDGIVTSPILRPIAMNRTYYISGLNFVTAAICQVIIRASYPQSDNTTAELLLEHRMYIESNIMRMEAVRTILEPRLDYFLEHGEEEEVDNEETDALNNELLDETREEASVVASKSMSGDDVDDEMIASKNNPERKRKLKSSSSSTRKRNRKELVDDDPLPQVSHDDDNINTNDLAESKQVSESDTDSATDVPLIGSESINTPYYFIYNGIAMPKFFPVERTTKDVTSSSMQNSLNNAFKTQVKCVSLKKGSFVSDRNPSIKLVMSVDVLLPPNLSCILMDDYDETMHNPHAGLKENLMCVAEIFDEIKTREIVERTCNDTVNELRILFDIVCPTCLMYSQAELDVYVGLLASHTTDRVLFSEVCGGKHCLRFIWFLSDYLVNLSKDLQVLDEAAGLHRSERASMAKTIKESKMVIKAVLSLMESAKRKIFD